jgi:predicted acetyltransferase
MARLDPIQGRYSLGMSDLEVRELTADDREQALSVRERSFGPLSDRAWWDRLYDKNVAAGRSLGVFAGTTMAACARLHAYQQLWGGRALPMTGVAGVTVAPEWRGRGVSTLLMKAGVQRGIDLGDVVSVLFPAALPPYRRLGWELAGSAWRTTFPADALRQIPHAGVDVRPAGPDDAPLVAEIMRRHAAARGLSGPLVLGEAEALEAIGQPENFSYIAHDGVAVYGWYDGNLAVETLVGLSPETTRALWSLVGSGSSAVEKVHTWLSPDDPVHWILDGKAALEVEQDRWMLRILDARRAIALRGWPSGVVIDISVRLSDALVPGNCGSFRLVVEGDTGRLADDDAASSDGVSLGANGFAALFAGTPMATLRSAGLALGGDETCDALLDAAFASRSYLVDRF